MDTSAQTPAPVRRAASPPRSDEILDACKQAFAQKGFDGASMQDLARAAGMSAGNFYRYFPSKDAIIVALVERETRRMEAVFAHILAAPDIRAAFIEGVGRRLTEHSDPAEGALWAEIEASATRRPVLTEVVQRMMTTVLDFFYTVFARLGRIPVEEARRRFFAHANLILMLVRGSATSECSVSDHDHLDAAETAALHALTLRVIDGLLSEISAGT